MNAISCCKVTINRLHIVPGLMLAVAMLPWSLGPATPAHANEPIERDHRGEAQPQLPPGSPGEPPTVRDHRHLGREDRDPVARIQLVLKGVHVLDDNDPGDGEMIFQTSFVCLAAPSPCLGNTSAGLDFYEKRFDAGADETYILNQTLPRVNESLNPLSDASVQVGYPIYSGQRYEFRFSLDEHDLFSSDDRLGTVTVTLGQENGWGLGTHTVRSLKGNDPGDYEIEYEIRPTPLPDLQPTSIEVVHLAGSTDDVVCMAVVNRGALDAGPFQVALLLNSVSPPIGTVEGGGLPSGQLGKLCLHADLPKVGVHQLAAIVDAPRGIAEESEINNRLDYAYDPKAINASRPTGPLIGVSTDSGSGTNPPPMPTPTPTPSPSPSLPDLAVSAIRVNGQVPDGKHDCQDGKNDITVVIKNAGPANAGPFAVELAVGKTVAANKSVSGLEAGKEREVHLDGVRLARGEHALAVTADSNEIVVESNEGNNTLVVTATCKDGDS
jgi:hypothetical protein